jgi:hypothetical protein
MGIRDEKASYCPRWQLECGKVKKSTNVKSPSNE